MVHFRTILIILLSTILLSGCNSCDRSPEEPVMNDTVADSTIITSQNDTTTSTVVTMDKDSLTVPDENDNKIKISPAPSYDRRARYKVIKAEPGQIIGQWFKGDLFEEFFSDGTGLTWDSSEDMSRDEAQQFDWKLEDGQLTITHNLTFGGFVRNVTYIAKVDSTQMLRYDRFGNSILFKKNF